MIIFVNNKILMSFSYKKYKLIFRYLKEELFFNLSIKIKQNNKKKQDFCSNMYQKNKFFAKNNMLKSFFLIKKISEIYIYNFFDKNLDVIFIPIFNLNWCYQEELIFMEAVEKFGCTNWEKVSQDIGFKNIFECEKHYLEIFYPLLVRNYLELNRIYTIHKRSVSNQKNFRNLLKISKNKSIFKVENKLYCEKMIIELNFRRNLTNNSSISIDKLNYRKKNKCQHILFLLFNQVSYLNANRSKYELDNINLTTILSDSSGIETKKKSKICNKNQFFIFKKYKKFKIQYKYNSKQYFNLFYKNFCNMIKLLLKYTVQCQKYDSKLYKKIFKSKNMTIERRVTANIMKKTNFYKINNKKEKLIMNYLGLNFVSYITIFSEFVYSIIGFSMEKKKKIYIFRFQFLFILFEQFMSDIGKYF